MIDFLTSFDKGFTTRAINKEEMAALPKQLIINTQLYVNGCRVFSIYIFKHCVDQYVWLINPI